MPHNAARAESPAFKPRSASKWLSTSAATEGPELVLDADSAR